MGSQMYPNIKVYASFKDVTVHECFITAWKWKHGRNPTDREMHKIIEDYIQYEDWFGGQPSYVIDYLHDVNQANGGPRCLR